MRSHNISWPSSIFNIVLFTYGCGTTAGKTNLLEGKRQKRAKMRGSRSLGRRLPLASLTSVAQGLNNSNVQEGIAVVYTSV